MRAGIRDEYRAEPADTAVAVGDTATLRCRAPRGDPEPRLRWTKDGQRLRASPPRISTDGGGGGGVLVIREVGRQDAGSYVCVAWNVAGERRSSAATLTVTGTYCTRVVHGLGWVTQNGPTDNSVLYCTIRAGPACR